MRILILGGDGYLGWPTAMHLSSIGHKVAVVDNYLRRDLMLKEDIELSLALAIENISSINSIVSVVEMPNVLKKTSFTYSESGKFIKLFPDEDNIALRRQDIDERFFKTNGSIYIVKRDFLFKNNSVYSNKILPYIMPKSRYIDIDNYEDLELANKML